LLGVTSGQAGSPFQYLELGQLVRIQLDPVSTRLATAAKPARQAVSRVASPNSSTITPASRLGSNPRLDQRYAKAAVIEHDRPKPMVELA
jgi:hypothetical protein